MSSYLTFYLVPRLSKKKYDFNKDDGHSEIEVKLSEGQPMVLMSYSRSSDVYQAYYETLHPAYCGNEDKYTELTPEDAQRVVDDFKRDLDKTKKRLEIDYKMLKEVGYNENMWSDIHSTEEYVEEQEETLNDLQFIAHIVYECSHSWTDFEKVLINVD